MSTDSIITSNHNSPDHNSSDFYGSGDFDFISSDYFNGITL